MKSDMPPSTQNEESFDIVIITIRKAENEAVLKRIPNRKPLIRGNRT